MPSKHAGRPAGGELGGRVLRRSHLSCCFPVVKLIRKGSESPELLPRPRQKESGAEAPLERPWPEPPRR